MRANAQARFFGPVHGVLDRERLEQTGSVGYPRLAGEYRGVAVQVHPVVDTLALRRLPVLWLLVTVQAPLPVTAKLDLMMRPAGPTTFSNFDLLPVTLATPTDFPAHAVLRTDNARTVISHDLIRPYIGLFEDTRAKELLIAPTGLRIVWMMAEADRARYGILRQAEFGPVELQASLLRKLLDTLIDIRATILEHRGGQT